MVIMPLASTVHLLARAVFEAKAGSRSSVEQARVYAGYRLERFTLALILLSLYFTTVTSLVGLIGFPLPTNMNNRVGKPDYIPVYSVSSAQLAVFYRGREVPCHFAFPISIFHFPTSIFQFPTSKADSIYRLGI